MYNAAKCNCGRGSALNNAAGGYSAASPNPAGFKGSLRGVERRGQGRRGENSERDRKGGEVGDVDCDAKLLSNCLNR